MSNQIFKKMNLPHEELEWLYVPDVEYCEYETCKRYLQLIVPYQRTWTEDKKFPLIMYIPGAAWHRQEMYNSIPSYAELAKRGFVVAVVQHRESDIATFPAPLIDVKKAIRFMPTLAEQFHIDTNHIFLYGNSSGGHISYLTGLTAATGEYDEQLESDISCKVNGIITYSAPTDMMLSQGVGPMEDFIGTDTMAHAPELAKRASCNTYVSKDVEIPPILMFHGIEDEVVPVEHARSFYRKLKECDKEVEYYELENENHCCPTFWEDDILDIIEAFIRRNCK